MNEFRVGPCLVRPAVLRIEREGEEVRVEAQVMDLLVYLAQRPGQTVSRDELRSALWPGTHVSDDALNRCVWKLRRALGAGATDAIETLPKRGYRLIPGVEAVPATDAGYGSGSSQRARASRAALVTAAAALAIALSSLLPRRVALDAPPRAEPRHAGRTRPFTSLTGYEGGPSFSADGGRVAFHHLRKGEPGPLQMDLYVQDVDGGSARVLVSGPADEMRPALSPDGAAIAFVRTGHGECHVVILSLESGRERTVAACGPDHWPGLTWSPDGRDLIHSRRAASGEPSRVYRTSMDGVTVALTDPPRQQEGDDQPALSRDGRWLAFARGRSPDVQEVFVRELPDGPERRVGLGAGRIAGLVFAQDDRSLIVSSDRTGTFRLWRVAIDGGPASELPTVGLNAMGPALSADGRRLVYEEWKSEINVRRFELRGDGPGAGLVESSRWDWQARWSPDGTRVAFLSNRSGASEVWVGRADGSDARKLTSFGASFAARLRWSPDGRQIALDVPRAGNLDVYRVDAEDGGAVRVTRDASDERTPSWSRDGRWLYFTSNREAGWQVWRTGADDRGSATRVTAGGGLAPLESEDGRSLLFVRPEGGIWRKRLPDGPEEPLAPGLRPSQWMNWDVAGEQLYYVAVEDWHVTLQSVNVAGGEPETVRVVATPGSQPEFFEQSGLAVSSDGLQALMATVDHSDSDLWIVDWEGGS